eukprot:1080174-Prorocentrum_minimum.AAC.3
MPCVLASWGARYIQPDVDTALSGYGAACQGSGLGLVRIPSARGDGPQWLIRPDFIWESSSAFLKQVRVCSAYLYEQLAQGGEIQLALQRYPARARSAMCVLRGPKMGGLRSVARAQRSGRKDGTRTYG